MENGVGKPEPDKQGNDAGAYFFYCADGFWNGRIMYRFGRRIGGYFAWQKNVIGNGYFLEYKDADAVFCIFIKTMEGKDF